MPPEFSVPPWHVVSVSLFTLACGLVITGRTVDASRIAIILIVLGLYLDRVL